MAETGANASVVFVPPAGAADAIMEAAAAGMPLIVAITEGVPVADMIRAKRYLEGKPVRLVGPNCPGVITPRGVQDRDHARLHPSTRSDRRCLPLRHSDL